MSDKNILEMASKRNLARKTHVLMCKKTILKTALKRVVAQKNYALLCLEGESKMESTI